jgi:hypothetical protein
MSERHRIERGERPISWDYQMDFSIKAYGLYGICPCKNQIKNIGVDCIRYKYTWIEDWGEPILQNYIMANEGYSLKELEAMPFYK